MEFMLETILDIKNNKKRPKEDTVQHVRIKKWLQKVLLVKNLFSPCLYAASFQSLFVHLDALGSKWSICVHLFTSFHGTKN